jgi:hypothetical protein
VSAPVDERGVKSSGVPQFDNGSWQGERAIAVRNGTAIATSRASFISSTDLVMQHEFPPPQGVAYNILSASRVHVQQTVR